MLSTLEGLMKATVYLPSAVNSCMSGSLKAEGSFFVFALVAREAIKPTLA